TRGHNWLRIDLLPGGRYVGIPRAAVNGRYDGLPPHSAKFNSERDNPPEARPLIATSPDLTIMPPMTAKIWLRRNGSMRPETRAFSPQTHACLTARIGSGPRMVLGTSAAHASSSRDSPDIERTSGKAQRFHMGYEHATARPCGACFQSLRALPCAGCVTLSGDFGGL